VIKQLPNVLLYSLGYGLLILSYRVVVYPFFEYAGFYWSLNLGKSLCGLALASIAGFLLPHRLARPSDLFLHVQMMWPVLPMLVLFGVMDLSATYVTCTMVAFGVMAMASRGISLAAVPSFSVPLDRLQLGLLVLSAVLILSIIGWGGLAFFNLDFLSVYEFRRDAATNLPAIYGYLVPWMAKVLLPAALVLAVVAKNPLRGGLALLGSVIAFGLTSHKLILFAPFFALIVLFVLRRKEALFFLLAGYLSAIIIAIGWVWAYEDTDSLAVFFLRRGNFLPALLNFYYFEFFQSHNFLLWAESRVTFGLIESEWVLTLPKLIGVEYFGNEATSANTGWIGSGYAQLGFLGMLVYALFMGALLSFLDKLGERAGSRIISAVMLIPMLAPITSSDPLTSMLTHGILVGLLVLMMLPTITGMGRRRFRVRVSGKSRETE
jgi:hypothetical protein